MAPETTLFPVSYYLADRSFVSRSSFLCCAPLLEVGCRAAPEDRCVLIPGAWKHVPLLGKKDVAGVIKGLEMGRVAWVIQVDPMESQDSYKRKSQVVGGKEKCCAAGSEDGGRDHEQLLEAGGGRKRILSVELLKESDLLSP